MRTAAVLLATLMIATALPAALPAASAATTHAHVAVIVEENRDLYQVVGAPDMPYFNSLASAYSSFTGWRDLTHPSEPNYVAMIAGSTLGVTDDGHYDFGTTPNLGAQLTAAGVSWKAYMEDLPYAGYDGDTYANYARKHDPFIMFGGNADNVVPASQYWSDLSAGTLPDFVFYVPNLQDDGHDAGNSVVDASLKSLVPPLLSSAWYAAGGTVVVAWDEDAGSGLEAHVVVSENSRSHANYNGNVYGDLRTIEEAYGLPLLGAASGATSYGAILGGAAAPAPAPGFAATFSPCCGNDWWVQTGVSSATSVASVCASVNGGACQPLADRGWGWASSFYVPTGATLRFTATSSSGATATSGGYSWPTAAPVAGSTSAPSAFAATFSNMRGNAWWVESDVATSGVTLAGVDASINGGAWIPLFHTSWGSWAKSIYAPAGSQVRFRADASDGSSVISAPKTW
jgi:acid phosphatase